MIARASLIALAATLASGCATMRHASQPSLHGVTDAAPYEVERHGNMLVRYDYTREVDKGEPRDLTPLFDHYDATREVQATASRYEKVAQWALPTAVLASMTMLGNAAMSCENEREWGMAAATSAAVGLVVSTVAHFLGQHEYGQVGEIYNERLRDEVAAHSVLAE